MGYIAEARQQFEFAWFLKLVERGRQNGIFTETVTITPALASYLLTLNPDNRRTNRDQIAKIAKDILADQWHLNGETIIISDDGYLNDGQNRLHGVLLANKSIKTLVSFGVPRESRTSVDMGRQRLAQDFLTMHGVPNASHAAAIVSLHIIYHTGKYCRTAKQAALTLTKQDILEQYNQNMGAYNEAVRVANLSKQIRSFGPSTIGTAYLILKAANPDRCDEFFERLNDGAGLSSGSPILALRNKLMLPASRLMAHEKLELILRGWNFWREGKLVDKSPPLMGAYPKVLR